MAYAYLNGKNYTTYQQQHDGVKAALLAAGWTQYDVVASTYTILRSNGSAADSNYMYLQISMTAGVYNYYTAWNSGTHTGVLAAAMSQLTVGATRTMYGYLNLNGFFIATALAGVFSESAALFRAVPTADIVSFSTTLTGTAAPGTSVVISVASTANFLVGAHYYILDPINNKRSSFKCTAIGTGTITAGYLQTGYTFPIGALVGCNFFNVAAIVAGVWQTNLVSEVGTYAGLTPFTLATAGYNFLRVGRLATSAAPSGTSGVDIVDTASYAGVVPGSRRLLPTEIFELVSNTNQPSTVVTPNVTNKIGIWDIPQLSHTLVSSQAFGLTPITQANNLDVQCTGQTDSGTTTGNNLLLTLNDTTKNWAVNSLAGLVLVITTGLGAGQTSKIVSNTATTITVTDQWYTIPIAETYAIVASAYRAVTTYATNANLYFPECL